MGFKEKIQQHQPRTTEHTRQTVSQMREGIAQEAQRPPSGPFSAKVQKHLEHLKQVPENRAAQAINRHTHTQSRFAEIMKERASSPSVNYLKIERLKRAKPKTPIRER